MTGAPTGWRKSSHSAHQVTCVEVGQIEGDWPESSQSQQETGRAEVAPVTCRAAVRDSKDRAAGYFTTTAQQWRLFVTAVKAGRFQA
ncbi:DUF397 domain-containing protein [Saccharopolyspora phatthalungensis]|uniref:DUF397 domain-containing protein n=1 Tax=Saccharopolyspora phatthalungensis TaxID=664693 RepID=A0A840QA45_9PSEU|nr:DUF397 domain-containing protein [Saccharopolyspora phatthalungensis]MBB5156621.1 hypothetical protein [Saccharopolyspora phatthalungensis]